VCLLYIALYKILLFLEEKKKQKDLFGFLSGLYGSCHLYGIRREAPDSPTHPFARKGELHFRAGGF